VASSGKVTQLQAVLTRCKHAILKLEEEVSLKDATIQQQAEKIGRLEEEVSWLRDRAGC
jgi:hypothetical protein